MHSPPPTDDIWPPPIFREVPNDTDGRDSTRRFELLDVGAPSLGPSASVEVEPGVTWRVVDGSATTHGLARRLIAGVRVEALRSGAARLTTGPDCPPVIAAAVRAAGGRDEGKQVVIDL